MRLWTNFQDEHDNTAKPISHAGSDIIKLDAWPHNFPVYPSKHNLPKGDVLKFPAKTVRWANQEPTAEAIKKVATGLKCLTAPPAYYPPQSRRSDWSVPRDLSNNRKF